jgi:putative membrane protein
MILPGVSGGFVLLLLGKYFYMMNAIATFDVVVLGVFIAGAVIGVIGFSNVLSWLLSRFHAVTLVTLGGFMLESLNKLWPWKETLETFVDRHGVVQPLMERNILPHTYEQLTGSSHFVSAVVLFLIGASIVFVVEFTANKLGQPKPEIKEIREI